MTAEPDPCPTISLPRVAPRPHVSRRTLVAGTAWAVPAVIVATAAPASAASNVCGFVFTLEVTCQADGQVTGRLCFQRNGCTGSDTYINIVSITGNGQTEEIFGEAVNIFAGAPPGTRTCRPSRPFALGPLATGTAVVAYTVNGGPTQTTTLTITPGPPYPAC